MNHAPPTVADPLDMALVCAIQDGLPLSSRPYAEVGALIGLDEDEVIARLRRLIESGDIRRLGVVVRHHALGYRSNAMVVWDVPDELVDGIGRRIGAQPCVNLCYRRPRRLPRWPYNLFCMIHGRSREGVLTHLEELIERCDLSAIPHEVLFSRTQFKQRGARYGENATRTRAPCPERPRESALAL